MDTPSVTVIGKPSAQCANKLTADTETRIEATRQKLGPEGLKKLEENLHAAQEKNEKLYPNEILSEFEIPDVKSINWIEVETATSYGKLDSDLQSVMDRKDSTVLPFCVEFARMSCSDRMLQFFLEKTEIVMCIGRCPSLRRC